MNTKSSCEKMGDNPDKKTSLKKILYKINSSDLKNYEQGSVYFSKPRLVAFHEDNNDKITPGKRIPYFKAPKRSQYPMDLNDGYETYRPRHSSMFSKGIELSLKYAMSPLAEEFVHDDALDNVERTLVYTRRGTLSHIMQSIYVKKYNDWSVRVSRYGGNIYMVQEETDESENQVKKGDTHHKRLEKLLFAESPNESPKIDEPCDANICLVGIHRSTLGKYDIVYSGEVQGIIAEEKFQDFDDIDALDKCRFVLTKQMWQKLKNNNQKLLNYWLQAYLANVKDLYVAFKNREGVVEEPIDHKIVSDLPKNRYWKPKICTSLLHDFLQRVEKLMANSNINCLNTAYVFNYNPNERSISYRIFKGISEKTFITKEYFDYCKENMS